MKTVNYNFNCDLSPVILWQYQDAEKIKGLIANEQEFMDKHFTDFWNKWNTDVLNLQTCGAFGLALWGRLLRVARPTYESGGVVKEYSDEQYRLILQSRIFLLTFDGSAKALNKFFKMVFPDIQVQIVDNYNMSVDINVLSDVPPDLKEVLRNDGFLPRPSGVEYHINFGTDYATTFGFENQTYTTEQGTQEQLPGFDNGVFYQ